MTKAASDNPRQPAGPNQAAQASRRNEFDSVRSTARRCLACQREPAADQIMTAVLVELARKGGKGSAGNGGSEFQRLDYCADCWPGSPWAQAASALLDEGQSAAGADLCGEPPVAIWNVRATPREKRKHLFVDDSVLANFFLRLADDSQPDRKQFRFVLMLILLRHRKLRHEGIERAAKTAGSAGAGAAAADTWLVRLSPAMAEATGSSPETIHRVVDPKMDESLVLAVAGQLGQILQEDIDLVDKASSDEPAGSTGPG
jgi:hypothetical protein